MDLIQEHVPVNKHYSLKEQTWLLPLRLSQIKYTEYVRGKDSKISFAFLLLTTVMMFTSTICVTSFHLLVLLELAKLIGNSDSKCHCGNWYFWEVLYVLQPQWQAEFACTCCLPHSAALLSLRIYSSSQHSQYIYHGPLCSGLEFQYTLSCLALFYVESIMRKAFLDSFCHAWHVNSVMFILSFFA